MAVVRAIFNLVIPIIHSVLERIFERGTSYLRIETGVLAPARKKLQSASQFDFQKFDPNFARAKEVSNSKVATILLSSIELTNINQLVTMSYFRITLMRSGIGLPKRTQGVLKALGLRTRMKTVFFPVTPEVAGQIMKVKELVAVQEVDKALTKEELREERRPDAGYYIETAVPR
jgi:large subunit ribosomal protein L30